MSENVMAFSMFTYIYREKKIGLGRRSSVRRAFHK